MENLIKIKNAKTGTEVTIDFAALPVAMQDYVVSYGLRQSLNDATASVKIPDAEGKARDEALVEADEKFQAKLEKLLKGTLTEREFGGSLSEEEKLRRVEVHAFLRGLKNRPDKETIERVSKGGESAFRAWNGGQPGDARYAAWTDKAWASIEENVKATIKRRAKMQDIEINLEI